MLGLRYTLLGGRISDSRIRTNRYAWLFSVNDTPVTLVGGGNGVVDTIASGRTVVVAGRTSFFGKRFLAYQLWVRDTGTIAGVSPRVPAFVLAITLGGLVAVALLSGLSSKAPPIILMIVAVAASVLMLSDALNCRALIQAARADSAGLGLSSSNRWRGP